MRVSRCGTARLNHLRRSRVFTENKYASTQWEIAAVFFRQIHCPMQVGGMHLALKHARSSFYSLGPKCDTLQEHIAGSP